MGPLVLCTVSIKGVNYFVHNKAILPTQLTSTSPLRSPDLTPCHFGWRDYVKYTVVVSHLPSNLLDLKQRITSAVHNVDETTLQRASLELGVGFISVEWTKVHMLSTRKMGNKTLDMLYFVMLVNLSCIHLTQQTVYFFYRRSV